MCQTRRSPTNDVSDGGTLSLQAMLDLLGHEYRRNLLHYLIEADQQTCSFAEAAESVLKQNGAETGADIDTESIKGSLLHIHLPKFDEADIIEFDQRSQTIRYHGDDRLETFFDQLQAFQ